MQPTMDKIRSMLIFLKKDSFVVPHHNLPMPYEAEGANFRPDKCFRLYRNGTMHYHGWGYVPRGHDHQFDINSYGIQASQRWIDRAYIFLIEEVREEVRKRTKNSKMKNVASLVLKFNGLGFIDIDPD